MTLLAKEGISSRCDIENLHKQVNDLQRRYWDANAGFERLYDATKDFRAVTKLAPQKVKTFFAEILQKAEEERLERKQQLNTRIVGR